MKHVITKCHELSEVEMREVALLQNLSHTQVVKLTSGGFGLAFIDDWNVCLAMTAKHKTTETDGGSVM